MSTVLATINTRVGIFDHELRVRRVNWAFRVALGLPAEGLRGLPFREVVKARGAPFIESRLREVLESGSPAEFDLDSSIAPGRTTHARIVPWPGGSPIFPTM